jgi:hypothetical protein
MAAAQVQPKFRPTPGSDWDPRGFLAARYRLVLNARWTKFLLGVCLLFPLWWIAHDRAVLVRAFQRGSLLPRPARNLLYFSHCDAARPD